VTRIGKKKWALLAMICLAVLALDLATKRAVTVMLEGEPAVRVLPFLTIDHTTNQGVAFGLLAGDFFPLIVVGNLLGVAAILAYVSIDRRPVLAGVAGGLLLGGSLGNMAERLTLGHVTDFLRFPYYPTFNVADVCIFVGAALVLVSLLRMGSGGEKPAASSPLRDDERGSAGGDGATEFRHGV
jgi:signal peptidase II